MGEVEAAQHQEQSVAGPATGTTQAALTKEATAKSLLITLRRLQSLKVDKAALEQRVEGMQRQLGETQSAPQRAEQQQAALLCERDGALAAAEAIRYVAM